MSSGGGGGTLGAAHRDAVAFGGGVVDDGVAHAGGDEKLQSGQAVEQGRREGDPFAQGDDDVEVGEPGGEFVLLTEMVAEDDGLHPVQDRAGASWVMAVTPSALSSLQPSMAFRTRRRASMIVSRARGQAEATHQPEGSTTCAWGPRLANDNAVLSAATTPLATFAGNSPDQALL